MKELIIVRGLPGSGKSTFAKLLGGIHIEADQYFMEGEHYKFDATKLPLAHTYCKTQCEAWMRTDGKQVNVNRIVVSNTFTQQWEMDPYIELANKYGYTIYTIILENRHGGTNVHGVPDDKLEIMRNRFEIKL
jgi:predicted kinase